LKLVSNLFTAKHQFLIRPIGMGRRYAEGAFDFAFSVGMALILDEDNADSVLRPQLGGLQPGVTLDFRSYA
jgi:hypothetical protein